MTINVNTNVNNLTFIISIVGEFDFKMLSEFRAAYSEGIPKGYNIIVDMKDTKTIDSSALGMLLNMKRFLELDNGEIKIINANDVVKKVFDITHFEKKFDIQ